MKKLISFLTVFLFAVPVIFAQTPKGLGKSDPEAKKILDAVSTKFKTYKTVKANFTLKVENSTGKEQGSKTGVVQMKGMKYKVAITGQEIICDGKTVWTYDKSANEVQISTLDNSAGNITPQKLFTNFYDKDFIYKLNGNVKQGNKTVAEIEMTPTDKRKNFFKVYLYVDEAQKMIVSSKIYENSGNIYTYGMSSLKLNQPLKDEMFVFNKAKYPGVEVIQQ